MMRAMVVKELRETIGFVALALVVLAYYVLVLMEPAHAPKVPFVDDSYFTSVAIVEWLLAVVLGLRQSAWEQIRGTYTFLLHRPSQRSANFAMKIATGVGLVQLVAGAAILWYGGWASMVDTHPSPFEWSMTAPAWAVWLSLPVAYLGAFLTGVRPARWFGTRLLPALAGSFLFLVLAFQSWPISLVGSLVLSAVLLYLIFREAADSNYA